MSQAGGPVLGRRCVSIRCTNLSSAAIRSGGRTFDAIVFGCTTTASNLIYVARTRNGFTPSIPPSAVPEV